MIDGRYVVLGLAQARSTWFRAVAGWAHSASIPVEFVKCVSAVELRAHLASGRAFSAVLVDGGMPSLDRDLIERARAASCAVLVVDDVRIHRDWRSLGAAAVINPVFERKDLLEVLADHAREVQRIDELPGDDAPRPADGRRGRVAMVCGAGGTGASTAAIALAQGLSADERFARSVLLADLALRADQAMLHDARDVVPGIQELVEAHRSGRPRLDELRTFTFDVEAGGYQLLLGLRRRRDWPVLRPRAFASTFESLLRGWRVTVCDTDADLEGEQEGGSADVEERHLMSRTAAAHADVVFAVGVPGMKGLHSLVGVIGELLEHGVDASRIVPVLNRAPKGGRQRSELTAATAALLAGRPSSTSMPSPIFLPERRVDDALRDGIRLPGVLTSPLAVAFNAIVDHSVRRTPVMEPQLVQPGSLGRWSPDVDAEPA